MTTYKQVRPLTRRSPVALSGANLFSLLAPRASVAAQNASVVARNRALVQQLFGDGENAGDEALVATLYVSSPGNSSTGNREMPAPAGMPMALRDFRVAARDIARST
jgi:hypothetical protein